MNIATTVPAEGGDDLILVGDGDDVVLGGFGSDYINFQRPVNAGDPLVPVGIDSGNDVIVGDNGSATFVVTVLGERILTRVETTNAESGSDDFIFASNGSDVVLGGSGADLIDADEIGAGAASGDDVILGDNGKAEFYSDGALKLVETTDATEEVAGVLQDFGGIDTILARDGSDVVFGGSGGDDIDAGTDMGRDVVVGDQGVANFAADGQLLNIATTVPAEGGDDLILVGDGDDVVLGGFGSDYINFQRPVNAGDPLVPVGIDSGNDVIVGDNGSATFVVTAMGERILTRVETTNAESGSDDFIFASNGSDVVLGGSGADLIDADEIGAGAASGDDVILGDNGKAEFYSDGALKLVETTDATEEVAGVLQDFGGIDTILARDGSDVVFGGSGGDDIDAGTDMGRDVVVGDQGVANFAADGQLLNIATTVPAEGGDDLILVGDGDDVVLGGFGSDYINFQRPVNAGDPLVPVGIDSGNDVIVGDNGSATFVVRRWASGS